jgi:hypothetical protein
MRGKRRWGLWPRRITNELNGIGGLAGVGGTAIGIAGWTALAGTAATVLMSGGAVIAVGAFGYAMYKAVPPPLRRPEDVIGETLELEELDGIMPPVIRLAIVGPTQAGKTTLKHRLSFQPKPDKRTQLVTAQIVSVPTSPQKYVAILDGGGEQFAQQFRLLNPADCLCLVLDHNISDTDITVDSDRLKQHADFLTQIRYQLIDSKGRRKKWIEVLANKRDLWQQLPVEQKTEFEKFYNTEVKIWENGGFADNVNSSPHSNEIADDIARIMSKIVSTDVN